MKNTFNPSVAPAPKSAAEKALDDWGVAYERKDGQLFVPGCLDISQKGLTELPDLTNVVVNGWFDCGYNELTSLKGAPRLVRNFSCRGNRLTSLEHAPQSGFDDAGGLFYCQNNNLTSLDPMPSAFALLMTDWGNFTMAKLPPDEIRNSGETRVRMEREKDETARSATVLESPLAVRAPLTFRHRFLFT